MTAAEFREIALSFAGAEEGAHMGHPDFRVQGRIFATLGYPDAAAGMAKLPLEDQKRLIEKHPETFYPAKGAWGLAGSTMVRLEPAQAAWIGEALELAWQNGMAGVKRSKKKAARV